MDQWIKDAAANLISAYKETDEGVAFLKKHKELDLLNVVLFLQYPSEYFCRIQRIHDLCSFMWAIEMFLYQQRNMEFDGFFGFVRRNFQVASTENVPILTYLILNCEHAYFAEELVNVYSKLFEKQYVLFIEDLKRRNDWKRIINGMPAGDWNAFKRGLAKLGNSKFELELKEYASSIDKE
jgi:hypothetical protein